MTINRKSFSSILPPEKQQGYLKVLSVSLTPAGYTRISAVRTQLVYNKLVDKYTQVMIHPDRAVGLDVSQFDAVSFSGIQPRNAPGEPAPNTEYLWARGCNAIGKHLVETKELEDEKTHEMKPVLVLAGLGIYSTADPSQVPE
jgi:hypothetical protein